MIAYYAEYRAVNPDRAGPGTVARDRLRGASTDEEANQLFDQWLASHKQALDLFYILPPIRLVKVTRSEKSLRIVRREQK